MNHNYRLSSYFLIVLFLHHVNTAFPTNISDVHAYGIKVGINNNFLVLAQNNQQPPAFLIQFAPYSDTHSRQCSLTYPNTTNTFIYTVALPKRQPQNQTRFFFAGELPNDRNTPFIGMATYNPTNNTSNTSQTTPSSCDNAFSYSIQYLDNYGHQEYYILGVDPTGAFAYGYSNEFVVVFDPTNTSQLNIWPGNVTWPHSSFSPHAVDISGSGRYGVIAGFIANIANKTAKYVPMIYLLNFNSSATPQHQMTVVNRYQPMPNPDTWQDLLTNSDANVYSAKYDMSVSIDDQGKVLVGMQFINRVFFLSVDGINPINLTYINRHTNGRSLGNGKSVAWLNDGIAAVLVNVYTLNYQWSHSQVFLFDIYRDGYVSTTIPISVFPNSHQLLPSRFSPIFLNVVSSPSSLALLDIKGNILVFSPTPAGFYPSVQDTGSMPIVTSPVVCSVGAYKNRSGIQDCTLCSTGTKNPGNSNTRCVACGEESFCPLGSVADVPPLALKDIFQVKPYPHSPESVIFDEILLHNMFHIGSGRCVLVSPLFWALIVAGIVITVIVITEILKLYFDHPRSRMLRSTLKTVFRHTDLICEGEYWVGGLASFSVIVLVSFSYAFSNAYLKQYPIEGSSPSYFACDTSLRNAKFETNVQSLSIPFTEAEKEMFYLLNQQNFTLHVDFVNTLITCDVISIQALFGLIWSTIRWLDCNNTNSILTLSILLPYQHISVRILLSDAKTIGGLRIGLSSPGHAKILNYVLEELHFYQSFSKVGYLLSKTLPVTVDITKIINETKPMTGEESEFGGIYVPTFTVDPNSLFVSNDQYVVSSMAETALTIVIIETPYYVKNMQEPIAREPEIIFRNLLFTVVCLEIVGLVFIFYVLVIKPIHGCCMKKDGTDRKETTEKKKQANGDVFVTIDSGEYDGIGNDLMKSRF